MYLLPYHYLLVEAAIICLAAPPATASIKPSLQLHRRYRRQFDSPATTNQDQSQQQQGQLDLNITVPYIFSARLYPYGEAHEDRQAETDPQPVQLQTPMIFLEKSYKTLYIHRDGVITLEAPDPHHHSQLKPARLPLSSPLLAVFWMRSRSAKIHFRETTDPSVLSLAQSEVNIQYRYGSDFSPKSVFIVTWEDQLAAAAGVGSGQPHPHPQQEGNVFQLSLILGENACFAHIVYSRLTSNDNAVAGFNGATPIEYFTLPGSGTPQAMELIEKSDIGIPGEWLFRIDEERIYLCGAGFQGIECVDSCLSTQWYLDCSRACHCADGNQCNTETGECPEGRCNAGWTGPPTCDIDVDECEGNGDGEGAGAVECPQEQPDCVNTPGAYLCLCFEYDNVTSTCKGSSDGVGPTAQQDKRIPVPVIPLKPLLSPTPTPSPSPSPEPFRFAFSGNSAAGGARPKPVAAVDGRELHNMATLAPLTIRPMLGTLPQNPLNFPPTITTPPSPAQRPTTRPPGTCPRCHPNAQCLQGKCKCVPGFIGDGITTCQDYDECEVGDEQSCGPHATCQNTVGSYTCVCAVGFIATGAGCTDLDECLEGIVSCKGGNASTCVNTLGGYECKCRSGFTGSPDIEHGCVDIDECELADYYCGTNSTCLNTPGSFSCECHEGYERVRREERWICREVDECLQSPCHPAAKCTNMDGSFHCECLDGYVGNGIQCDESILFPVLERGAEQLLVAMRQQQKGAGQVEVKFTKPLGVFGKWRTSAYISSNGMISFENDEGEKVVVAKNISSIHSPSILPYHLQFNPTTSSSISHQQIYEGDEDQRRAALLKRVSLVVQDRFHLKTFKATALHIFTFDGMQELNVEKVNTFQLLLAHDSHSGVTLSLFLYEHLGSSPRGLSGIVAASAAHSLSIPTDLLLSSSNVGQRGRWIFRVDGAEKVGACPAGALGPPLCSQECLPNSWGFDCAEQCRCADGVPCDFASGACANGKCARGFTGANCQEDIDECSGPHHRCHPNATCTNSRGSFTCKCNFHFRGDGQHCEATDECLIRFNSPCAANAHCDTTNADYPECVCNESFHGDGRRRCDNNSAISLPTAKPATSTTSTERVSSSGESEHPFVMHNWVDAEAEEGHSSKDTTKGGGGEKPTTKRPSTPAKEKEGKKPKGNELDMEINAGRAEESTEGSGTMMLMVPVVLGVIWLVLMIVFVLVVCCRKRRSRRANKYSPTQRTTTGGGAGWMPRDYHHQQQGARNSYFSQYAYT